MNKFPLAILTLITIETHAAQYFQDFTVANIGDTNFADGSQVIGAPGVAVVHSDTLKELRLTPSQPGAEAAFIAPPLDIGKKTLAFSAKWNALINFAAENGGEGFQFTFGKVEPSQALAGWTNPVGLTFRVQTTPGAAALMILVNGQLVTNKPFAIEPSSTKRKYFEVDWRYTNGMTVKLDGIPVLSVTTLLFAPSVADQFVWLAHNGAGSNEIALDNIAVVTGGTLAIVPGSGFFSSQRNPNYGPMKAYDDDNASEFAVFAHSGFVGGNVSPARSLLFYSLTSGLDAPDPHQWILEGGPNSAGPWTPVATGDSDFLARQETRIWPVTNNAAFPSFRFSFPTNNSATLATYVGDIRLLEFKPYAPPFVANGSRINANEFELTFAGPPGSNYVAQFTTDFITWTDFATNTAPQSGTWNATDTSATSPLRFYRLRQ